MREFNLAYVQWALAFDPSRTLGRLSIDISQMVCLFAVTAIHD